MRPSREFRSVLFFLYVHGNPLVTVFVSLCFSLAFAVPVCLAIFPQQRYVCQLCGISVHDHKLISFPPPPPPPPPCPSSYPLLLLPLLLLTPPPSPSSSSLRLLSSSMPTSSLEPGVREAILSTHPDIKTVYFNKGL